MTPWMLALTPVLLTMSACDQMDDEAMLQRAADTEAFVSEDEADEQELAVEDEVAEQAPDAADDPRNAFAPDSPTPLAANNISHLNTCEWKTASTSSNKYLYVDCEAYQAPVSGGCHNSSSGATIQSSMPFENGTFNFPEDSEAWFAVDGQSGWRCKKDANAGTLQGAALCCGLQPPS